MSGSASVALRPAAVALLVSFCHVKATLTGRASVRTNKGSQGAQAPQATRRYSYEPSLDAPSTRRYEQPRYFGGGMRSRSSAPARSLQKTDFGKYTTHNFGIAPALMLHCGHLALGSKLMIWVSGWVGICGRMNGLSDAL